MKHIYFKQESTLFKKILLPIIKLSIALAIIVYMINTDELNLHSVKNSFHKSKEMLLALACIFIGTMISFIRWYHLLKAQNIIIQLTTSIRFSFIGLFFNTIALGRFGGDIVKAWYLIKEKKEESKTTIMLSIVVDRVIGMTALILISAIAALFNINVIWNNEMLRRLSLFIIIIPVLLFIFYLLFYRKNSAFRKNSREIITNKFPAIESIINKLRQSWSLYRSKSNVLLFCLCSALITHFFTIMAILFCASSIESASISLYELFLLSPIGLLISSLPITPEGLGVGQLAFSKLFSLVQYGSGGELFTLFITLQIVINLLGIFFYLLHKKVKPAV